MGIEWGRNDRRLMIGGLCGIGFALSTAVLLRQVPWAHFGIKWWATSTQLLGTLITGFGLLYAWLRATRFWDRVWPQIQRVLAWLFGPTHAVVHAPAMLSSAAKLDADVFVGLRLNRGRPVAEQLEQIEAYINTRLPQQFTDFSNRIRELKRALEDARSESQEAVAQAAADARAAIDKLTARLDTTQALDLTWAIVGLFITAGGIILSYGAQRHHVFALVISRFAREYLSEPLRRSD